MESNHPLATLTEGRISNDCSPGTTHLLHRESIEVEVTSLEEAKSVIAALRARQRAQAHQMLAWRRTLKLQVNYCARPLPIAFLYRSYTTYTYKLRRHSIITNLTIVPEPQGFLAKTLQSVVR